MLLSELGTRAVRTLLAGLLKNLERWMKPVRVSTPLYLQPARAYLLRQPAHKKLAWRDLQAVRDRMAALGLPEV